MNQKYFIIIIAVFYYSISCYSQPRHRNDHSIEYGENPDSEANILQRKVAKEKELEIVELKKQVELERLARIQAEKRATIAESELKNYKDTLAQRDKEIEELIAKIHELEQLIGEYRNDLIRINLKIWGVTNDRKGKKEDLINNIQKAGSIKKFQIEVNGSLKDIDRIFKVKIWCTTTNSLIGSNEGSLIAGQNTFNIKINQNIKLNDGNYSVTINDGDNSIVKKDFTLK